MKMIINRFKDIYDGTLGEFKVYHEDKEILNGYTLEPVGEDTIARGKDKRIPAGEYTIDWHDSVKFKRKLPRISNHLVPKDRYILIHAGNFAKDTEGCILVGSSYDDKGVYNSKETLLILLAILNKNNHYLIINNTKESNERLSKQDIHNRV